jgi:hypothetical protein
MVYQIVLVDGKEINGWTDSAEFVAEMMMKYNIYIIQENDYPDKVTYIMPERVSHYRFPKNALGVAKPI